LDWIQVAWHRSDGSLGTRRWNWDSGKVWEND